MEYSYTPTYYSSLHHSITSICKNILPFSSSSLRKRRLPPAEQKLSKQQSDNLKWQQESYHRILNLIGLRNEGIVQESEVSAFRSQLLDTLIASPSPINQEHPTIIRDKLLFLQELLYAKCVSEEEYHSSKRPLLQRLAVQGAEIEARDVIVAGPKSLTEKSWKEMEKEEEEEWSVIDIKDDECSLVKGKLGSRGVNPNTPKNKSPSSHMKQRIKGGAASIFSLFDRSDKKGKRLGGGQTDTKNQVPESSSVLSSLGGGGSGFPANNNSFSTLNQFNGGDGCFEGNPFWEDAQKELKEKESESRSILMLEDESPLTTDTVKKKKKAFPTSLFKQREEIREVEEETKSASKKKKNQLGFNVAGFKKWKTNNWDEEEDEEEEDESTVTPLAKQSKRKMMKHSSSIEDHKVLGDNVKKELFRIQTELSSSTTTAATTNSNLCFSNDQMQANSTTRPHLVDKADLQKFFPKTWCERNGDELLDVVKNQEIKIKNKKHHHHGANTVKNNDIDMSSSNWVANFDDNAYCNNDMNENSHPNLFFHQQQAKSSSSFIVNNQPRSYYN